MQIMMAREAAVGEFAATLRRLLGTFPGEGDLRVPIDPSVSLAAFLATLPDVRRYHRDRGISNEISWATLADLGRQLSKHRRIHGEFGLKTHWWMCTHWTGMIYQLGRLQYLIHQPTRPVPGVELGEWVIGVHIPESGPLIPEVVDESLAQAKEFFVRHFSERPVRTATLGSWLLDPYLLDDFALGIHESLQVVRIVHFRASLVGWLPGLRKQYFLCSIEDTCGGGHDLSDHGDR